MIFNVWVQNPGKGGEENANPINTAKRGASFNDRTRVQGGWSPTARLSLAQYDPERNQMLESPDDNFKTVSMVVADSQEVGGEAERRR